VRRSGFKCDSRRTRQLFSSEGKLSGYVSGGATNIDVTDVAVTGIKRLQGVNPPK
jgi:hypothetical protein